MPGSGFKDCSAGSEAAAGGGWAVTRRRSGARKAAESRAPVLSAKRRDASTDASGVAAHLHLDGFAAQSVRSPTLGRWST